MIPKIIHYCWFGPKEQSQLVKQCIETWKVFFPEWEFILWNESNSPLQHPFVSKALKDKKYAFVADYVRCHALYEYGGVYLDTDVEVLKSFDDLLEYDIFLGSECINSNNYNCAVAGSIKGDNFFLEMLNYYNSAKEYIPIPVVASSILENIKHGNYGLFSYEYFYPFNPYDPLQEKKILMYKDVTEKTYAIHHWDFSWKPNLLERIFSYLKKKIE